MSRICVYEYGLRPPRLNADLVGEQMRAAHRYRNRLTEIERDRRARVRAILVNHPDTAQLAADVEVVRADLERHRQGILDVRRKARKRRADSTAEQQQVARELVKRLREMRSDLRNAKRAITSDPQIAEALEASNEQADQAIRDARATCGVYWGTYLLAERASFAARQERSDPRFLSWTGEGMVSVQLQGGLDLDALQTDTQLQILGMDDPRTGRRAGQRRVLRMRVQSNASRQPVWAEWTMEMHRPIPPGSVIKMASISRRRRDATTWAWRVHITVELGEGTFHQPGHGKVALNLGWCQRPDGGLRAGYVVTDTGEHYEIALPASILERHAKSESIRSYRDKDLNEMRSALLAWIHTRVGELPAAAAPLVPADPDPNAPARSDAWFDAWWTKQLNAPSKAPKIEVPPGTIPPELAEDVKTIHLWRSAQRFRRLVYRWRSQRFEGDDDIYKLMERWRYRDQHLEQYESGLRRGALGHRREIYRRAAADLAARYHTLVIDNTDLTAFQRSPSPEDERTELATVKYNQKMVAPYALRQSFVNAFSRGGAVEKVDRLHVTSTCHQCMSIETVDRFQRTHVCGACSNTWDQDYNACKNLLRARLQEEAAPPKASRWSRLKRASESVPPSDVQRKTAESQHDDRTIQTRSKQQS